jgi:mono/diheme cytochrome c family protein
MYRSTTAAVAAAAVGLTLAGLAAAGGDRDQRAVARPTAAAPAGVAAAAPAQAPVRTAPVTPRVATTPAMSSATQTELVATYCSGCHSDRAKAGGLSLASFNAMRAAESPEVVEKILRKLRAGMMPPAGAKRPPAGSLDELMVALEARMDEHAAINPNPGWRPFQRLNRAEYARAVQDLLGVEVDVAPLLPPDTISHGFDNVADAQTFSPTLLEGYLRAASRVAALAIGDPDSAPAESTYSLPKTASQLARAEGAPLGTRGGVSVMHTFPADGEYVFRLDMFAEPLGLLFGNTATGEQIEVSINGERVALFDIDPRMNETTSSLSLKTPSVHVRAGPQRVTAAFLQRFEGPVNDLVAPIEHTMADTEIGTAVGITTLPHLRNLAVVGPHSVTGMSDTVSRRTVFTCRPTTEADEAACASSIVKGLAARAFRRAPTAREVTRLLDFYDTGRRGRTFEVGVTKAVEAILASPQFLFRLENTPATAKPGQPYRLADVELASRLSFFLWAAGPDPALLAVASQGQLAASGQLEKQVTRLLADPRSQALATRFASQWLRLQDLDDVSPDPILYPYYDRTLAQALQRETELFLDSLVRDDRSILDMLAADFTYVNDRVARHYGLPGVSGPQFRRVSLPAERRGILGHGSVLTLTSIADRTSPVQRGKWIMEVLLGSPPPAPPPNVPALEETKATADGKMLSVRERMETHRKNPACQSCHKVIDPLGLALEHFDATGRYRIKDNGVPVDAVGDLYDGTRMDGAAGLRGALLQHKDAFLLSFTEHLMTYALGRRVEAYDMPAVRAVIRRAAKQHYRISAFVQGIVASDPFQKSVVRATVPPTTDLAPALRD